MVEASARILVVDDDATVRMSLSEVLARAGMQVRQACSGEEALGALSSGAYDLVVLDLRMPRLGGLTVLQHARRAHPDTAVVVMTGYPSIETAKEAIELGAFDYLMKPLDAARIRSVVARALAWRPWNLERRS